AEEKKRVDKITKKGIDYLRKTQKVDGYWDHSGHPVGLTALAGLTMLESKVKAKDPAIQNAATYLRIAARNYAQGHRTYELSLVVLFFSRLVAEDPKNKQNADLLEHLTLRIIASQTAQGGWGYGIVQVNPTDTPAFLRLLKDMRKAPLHTLLRQQPAYL